MNTSCKRVTLFAPRRGVGVFGCDLAIDPGVHTGWALFGNDLLVACGSGEPPLDVGRRVVIELPQVYPNHPVPPNDLIALAFLAGRYAGVANTAEVYTVSPHAWKGNLPKKVCADRAKGKLSLQELEVLDACGVPKGELHNVLDAIGIGLVAFKGEKM